MSTKLPKVAKAIAGGLALAATTALGFMPHTDIWFNILTGVVAILGTYGIYAIPNKVLAEDVLGILGRVLPAPVVARIAPIIQEATAVVDPPAVDMTTNPPMTPIPAVTPPAPADAAVPPVTGK